VALGTAIAVSASTVWPMIETAGEHEASSPTGGGASAIATAVCPE
jgi:hypothetical protein